MARLRFARYMRAWPSGAASVLRRKTDRAIIPSDRRHRTAAALLGEGELVVVPTDTIYGISPTWRAHDNTADVVHGSMPASGARAGTLRNFRPVWAS